MAGREVVVRLAAPLGNHVLINLGNGFGTSTFGSPLAVIPHTTEIFYDQDREFAMQRWCRGESGDARYV